MYTAYELERIEKYILVPESLFDADAHRIEMGDTSADGWQRVPTARDWFTVREACGDPDGEHDEDA